MKLTVHSDTHQQYDESQHFVAIPLYCLELSGTAAEIHRLHNNIGQLVLHEYNFLIASKWRCRVPDIESLQPAIPGLAAC